MNGSEWGINDVAWLLSKAGIVRKGSLIKIIAIAAAMEIRFIDVSGLAACRPRFF